MGLPSGLWPLRCSTISVRQIPARGRLLIQISRATCIRPVQAFALFKLGICAAAAIQRDIVITDISELEPPACALTY